MPHLLEATFTIRMDEPAMMLRETIRPRPDFKGRNRYQIIWVVRNDRVVEWKHDMGPEKEFTADQFTIIGGEKQPDGGIKIWETVGSLRDMADHIHGFGFAADQMYENKPLLNLWESYMHEEDKQNRALVGRKTFAIREVIEDK